MALQNSWYDVPRFFEVDYFTLSTFVISTAMRRYNSHPLPVHTLRILVFNMYNWKYMT